jgi:mono/diheme cytochrome c family protein
MNILAKTTILISATVIVLMSCHGTKKSSTTQTAATTPPEPPPALVTATATVPGPPPTARVGIVPGELELTAIKQKYPETTAQNLANGHELYIGKCTDCHRKKNIYAFSETRWKDIIDDMAQRSKLTAQETDDLYKYVLSMKATQGK